MTTTVEVVWSTLTHWLNALGDALDTVHEALFVHVIQPLLPWLGLTTYTDDAFAASQWLVVGALEVMVIAGIFIPLERLKPFEPLPATPQLQAERRQAVRVDIIYTLLDRLGVLRLATFFLLEPVWIALFGWLSLHDMGTGQLDQWLAPWWPGVTDTALFAFVAYLVILDCFGYWIHRFQHRWNWWWALHAVHHSQQHMTAWSDNRTHLLDTLLTEVLFVLLARLIGVPPDQFILLTVLTKLSESLAHANINIGFGRWGQYLWVDPRFHRVHHGIDLGSNPQDEHLRYGCNYAVLFPVWDVIFGSALFNHAVGPTGIHDQRPGPHQVDYGQGFWRQQTLGLQRLFKASRRK